MPRQLKKSFNTLSTIITDPRVERDRLFYNLKPGERAKIREFQQGRDPITGESLSMGAHIDHDHDTGLIRGLLNPLTNKFLIDDIEILLASIAYLRNPPGPHALGGPVYGLLGKAQKKKKMLYGPDGRVTPLER